jgi:hypothetical protein
MNRQEVTNVNRGLLVALAHCEENAKAQNRKIQDFRDALYERELMLLDQSLHNSLDPKNWNYITEMVDTPPDLSNFFTEFSSFKKWTDLSSPQQELFRAALSHATADEL